MLRHLAGSVQAKLPGPVLCSHGAFAAVGVDETECSVLVRHAVSRGGDIACLRIALRVNLDPLFPLARGLRLVVGVQQQSPAQRAPAMLRLKQA